MIYFPQENHENITNSLFVQRIKNKKNLLLFIARNARETAFNIACT